MRRKFDAMCRQYEVKEAAGKNLINPAEILYDMELRSTSGHVEACAGWYVTGWIPVKPNTTYTISGVSSLYRAESPVAGINYNYDPNLPRSQVFTTGPDTNFVRFNSQTEGYDKPQLELGSVATAYEPYGLKGNTEWSDGLKSGFPSVKMLGKTEQQTYTGKNLFNVDAWLNACLTKDGDVYTITRTENVRFTGRAELNIPANTAVTIMLDFLEFNGVATEELLLEFLCADGTYLYRGVGPQWLPNVYTPSKDVVGVRAYVQAGDSVGANYRFKNLQFELGGGFTGYEPYVGGIPAPNPEYPQEVKANNAKVVSRSKNMLDFVGILGEGYTNTLNGVTVTIEDGYAVFKGEHTSEGYSNVLEKGCRQDEYVLPAGTYSLPANLVVGFYKQGTADVYFGNKSGTFTLAEPAWMVRFYVAFYGPQTVDTKIPLTIVCGSEIPTEYIPYHDGGEAVAPELYAIGDYRDEWNPQTGKGLRRIGKIVLDGTETLYLFDGIYPLFYSASPFAGSIGDAYPGFYSHGEYHSISPDYSGTKAYVYDNGYLRVRGPETITTVDAFKTWLAEQYAAGTPVTVCYILSEPVPFQTDPMPLTCPTGYGQIIQVVGDIADCPLEVKYLTHGGNKA